MVRSSEIVKSSQEEQKDKDSRSPFLRLSDIMKFGTTADKPAPDMPFAEKPSAAVMQEVKASPPANPAQAIVNVNDVYHDARNYMQDIRQTIVRDRTLDIVPGFDLVRKIVSLPEMVLQIHPLTVQNVNDQDHYIFQPIHTMIYALKVGLHMHYTTEQMIELGLSTLFQNVGMFLMPDVILQKNGPLTESEFAEIRKHPEIGSDLLSPYQHEYPWLLKAVYQHHERENGQGYPQGIKGDAINEYAKIIGICDSYEAMTHSRPHKRAIMQFDSIRQLIQSKEGLFSPNILKLFLQEMTIYPVGSYIKLNNAAIGRVIATNKLQPLKPVIEILIDGKGDRLSEKDIVNLAENAVLTITEVVSEDKLPT
jgi:HD-GYP domain-containing protein (c-di-GMP phosphodiesterase class II)